MLIGLRDRCPIFDEIVGRVRQTNVHAIALVDRNALWRVDLALEQLVSARLGDFDVDGIVNAITLCGTVGAVTSLREILHTSISRT